MGVNINPNLLSSERNWEPWGVCGGEFIGTDEKMNLAPKSVCLPCHLCQMETSQKNGLN